MTPEEEKFLENIEKTAYEMMHKENLSSWKFQFDRAKKRFGLCNFTKKTISLSEHLCLLNTEKDIILVLIHEMAHAKCGHSAGHGKTWKMCVEAMGGIPKRCYGKEIATPLLQFTAICPACKTTFQARKKSKKAACKQCCKEWNGGKFSKQFLFQFSKNKT